MTIDVPDHGQTTANVYRADPASAIGATFVFAHGAGAGQQSGFMVAFATALAARGLDVVTFNFLYIEQGRKVPDKTEKLEACYRAVIAAAQRVVSRNSVIIGGKSMGGRIASHLAATDPGIAGLVLLGYPLHPPGRPDQLRIAHLPDIGIPVLCLQGERDQFGTPDELRPHLARISAKVSLYVVEHGDHSLAPSRSTPVIERTYGDLQNRIVEWIRGVQGPQPPVD